VGGGDLAAQARLALRDDGEAEAGDVDPLLEERSGHGERLRGVADDDGDNRVRAVRDLEARRRDRLAEVDGVFPQPADGRRVLAQHPEGLERSRGDGGRERIGEEVGPAPLPESLDQGLRARREPAGRRAHRLAERAGRDGDPVHHALLLRRAAPGRAEHAGRVRVVHGEENVVFSADPGELAEVRLLALHREDAVGHHETEARCRVRSEHCLEGFRVIVRHAVALGLAEADAVDDRGVVQLVGVEPVRLVQDRREEPFVGVPARHVQDRVVRPEKGRDLGLELAVKHLSPADEAHGRHAGAPLVDRVLLRLAHPRVVGEAQVVVRGQHHELAAVDRDPRILRRLEDELLLVGPGLPQLRHFAGEVLDELHARPSLTPVILRSAGPKNLLR
jgi:hypothetical protein